MTSDPRLRLDRIVNENGNANTNVNVNGHTPLVYRFLENGREYYAFNGAVVYPLPCDEDEKRRLDQFHHLIHNVALNGRLHTADLPARGSRPRTQILDVGYGTGIWVTDMAARYPDMDVHGIDLIDNHSTLDTPLLNARFRTEVDFTNPDWGFSRNSFDLIRMCQLCGAVESWSRQYEIVYRHLKPGTGFVEHIEIDWTPRLSGGSEFPPALDALSQWWRCMVQASASRPIAYREDTGDLLRSAGFEDLTHRTIRISLQSSPRDERDANLKRYFQSFMCWKDERDGGMPVSFEALSTSLFYRQLGISADQTRSMCNMLRRIYMSDKYPIYHNIHIWTARKPAR